MMADSTRQYLRKAQLVVGKQGQGLLIEFLRIAFEVEKTSDGNPNTASIQVYNLNETNHGRIKNEFDDVILNVGYGDSLAVIFRGNIKRVFKYKQGNDWITELECGDGDQDFKNAIINETIEAGVDDSVIVDRAVGTMSKTTKGPVKGLSPNKRLRGKVMSGNTRDVLSKLAKDADASWSIQDGQLTFIPINGVLDDEAIVVNSQTGMLSAPEVGDEGIKVKSLLNPLYKIYGRVKLDNNNMKGKKQTIGQVKNTNTEVTKTKKDDNPVRQDPDGIYKIYKMKHKGDTHGSDWYSELETVSLDAAIPKKKGS
jgi:hypothetical protein